MHLLVGLGNIGAEYELTRHNFGFLLVDEIVDNHSFLLEFPAQKTSSNKFKSEVFVGAISNQKIIAIKPQTLMNLSGVAVSKTASFYKIPPSNIIVMHDDLDLELGRIKVKIGGADGGHNGLKSIDSMIGKDYIRIRLGIGHPRQSEKNQSVSNYVLSNFSKDEVEIVKNVNKKISKLLDDIISGRVDSFMNKFYLP